MILKADFKIHLIRVKLLKERRNLSLRVKVKKMTLKVRKEKIGTRKEMRVKKKKRKKEEVKKNLKKL